MTSYTRTYIQRTPQQKITLLLLCSYSASPLFTGAVSSIMHEEGHALNVAVPTCN